MKTSLFLTAATALSLVCLPALAQQKVAAAPQQPTILPSGPQAALAATEVSPAQLEVATRVLVGRKDCEFNQHVTVQPVDGKAGHFRLDFKQKSYVMTPENTSTGAVRLEDKQSGMVWIQIANKSMLMNSKAGQRVADACTHPTQRAFVASGKSTGPSLLGNR